MKSCHLKGGYNRNINQNGKIEDMDIPNSELGQIKKYYFRQL